MPARSSQSVRNSAGRTGAGASMCATFLSSRTGRRSAKIVPGPRDNGWARSHLPQGRGIRLLYAGTLGRKHNPLLLIDLLRAALGKGIPARLVVASEGEGIEAVRQIAERQPELPITLLPFQPASELSEMLSSADVLLALLEPGASKFSIPSKVLSSLAAGRPVLGLMPRDNPAAVDIGAAGGYVGTPDAQGVVGASDWLQGMVQSPGALVLRRRAKPPAFRRAVWDWSDRHPIRRSAGQSRCGPPSGTARVRADCRGGVLMPAQSSPDAGPGRQTPVIDLAQGAGRR